MATRTFPSTRQSGHTVLVVDDSPSVLAVCHDLLKWAGYTAPRANGSAEALELVQRYAGDIHVVLVDLMLPPVFRPDDEHAPYLRLDGDALAKRLITLRRTMRPILMSAYSDRALTTLGVVRGAVPFIHKPFQSGALLAIVGEEMGKGIDRVIRTARAGTAARPKGPTLIRTGQEDRGTAGPTFTARTFPRHRFDGELIR